MNHDELAFFNRQLSAMLREGIPLEGSLRRLCRDMRMFLWLVSSAGEDLAGGFERAAETYRARSSHRAEMLLYAALPSSLLLLGLMIMVQISPLMHTVFGLPRLFDPVSMIGF